MKNYSNDKLPDFAYQYNLSRNANFNNQLIAGHNAGLALYDYESDTKLYKNLDMKPLDAVNFDNLNEKLNENYYNRSAYDEASNTAKGFINGTVDTINKVADKTSDNIKSLFNFHIDEKEVIKYIGALALLIIIVKKI